MDQTDDGFAADWLRELHPFSPAAGFYRKMRIHSLVFADRSSDQLVVSFDNLSNVADKTPGREPWGWRVAARNGWAMLGVMANRPVWYRDPELFDALEGLAAEGLFARYARVLFFGASMGGYAALAFSRLCPGAHVLAFSPQASLAREHAPWETRFGPGRRQDWTGRYADAAEGLGDAGRVTLIYDPDIALDVQHIARLRGQGPVTELKAFYGGHKTPLFLRKLGLLRPMVERAAAGALDPATFYRWHRRRRLLPWYRKSLVAQARARGHEALIPAANARFKALRDANDASPDPQRMNTEPL